MALAARRVVTSLSGKAILKRDQESYHVSQSLGYHGEQRREADSALRVQVDIKK